jgi:hypothetical protein
MTNNYSDYLKFTAEVGYNIIQKGSLYSLFKNPIVNEGAFNNFSNGLPIYRQTYNAVGLKFFCKCTANIAVFMLSEMTTHLVRQLTLPFTLNYKSFYK